MEQINMSGGFFEYKQYSVESIASDLKEVIIKNNDKTPDEWGSTVGRRYDKKTVKEFQKAWRILNQAAIYSQRIDWLLSGDDCEESFHRRLAEELQELKKKKMPKPLDKYP
jgi:intergrase/recombinase